MPLPRPVPMPLYWPFPLLRNVRPCQPSLATFCDPSAWETLPPPMLLQVVQLCVPVMLLLRCRLEQ